MEKEKSISKIKVLQLSELAKIKGGTEPKGATPATKPGATVATDPSREADTHAAQ